MQQRLEAVEEDVRQLKENETATSELLARIVEFQNRALEPLGTLVEGQKALINDVRDLKDGQTRTEGTLNAVLGKVTIIEAEVTRIDATHS